MRLYFFPALLPLAPILPWLLTGLGALAAGLRAIRHRRAWALVSLLLFLSAASVAVWQKTLIPDQNVGTRLTPAARLPATVREATTSHGSALDKEWFQMLPARALSAPVLSKDLIILGMFDGRVSAFSRSTGETAWTVSKDQPILSAAAVSHQGIAYVGEGLHTAQSSSLTAIQIQDGTVIWQREFLGHLETPIAIDELTARLYVAAGPSGIWALNAIDGSVLWHAPLGHSDATPLLLDGSLLVAAQPDESKKETFLHALHPVTGESAWSIRVPGQPWGAPLPSPVSGEVLLATSIGQLGQSSTNDQGWTHSISLRDHTLRWTRKLASMVIPGSRISKELGLFIHTLKSGELVAQDAASGEIRWQLSGHGEFQAAPTEFLHGTKKPRRMVAALTASGDLLIVDAAQGKLISREMIDSGSTSAPLYEDGVLYLATPASLSSMRLDLETDAIR